MKIKSLKYIRATCAVGAALCAAFAAYNMWHFYKDSQEQQGAAVFVQKQEAETVEKPQSAVETEISTSEQTPIVDMKALSEVNGDAIGWLKIPGSNINYPIVQGTDNEYYLSHSYTGKENSLGSIFMDFRVDVEKCPIYLLYGHNIALGGNKMFSELVNYKDQKYGEDHSSIFLKVGEEEKIWKVFAVCEANSMDVNDLEAYFATELPTQDEFDAYVENLKVNALYTLDETQNINHLLVLTTCMEANSSSTKRIVVCAKPIEEME